MTGPEGGSTSLRLRRITELLDVGPQPVGAGRVQGDGAEDPGEAERDRGDQRRTTGPVGQVQGRAPDHLRPQPQGEALDRDGDEGPGQQRPERCAERRVGRLGALGEDQRAEAAAGKGAGAEADQRHRPDDQPLPIAPDRQGEGEGDDRPIQNGHF